MNQGRLQHEVKKKHPFQSLEQEVCLNLMRTNDQMHIRFARLFREHGLTPSQYNVLRILRGEGKPLECMEIAGRTVTVVPGITGLIDRLEVAGLVARERSDKDRRKVYVAITEKALDLLADLDVPVMDLHQRLVGNLSRAEIDQLNRLLEKARAGFKKDA
jgi:MarR family transcriptional regulator, 2-MHQ and catechol-resistance regulon repressor